MTLLQDNPNPALWLTALAPMQDVTDRAFMRLIARKGAPDFYVTEYLRVHVTSQPEAHILEAIDHNETGRPIVAQLLGEDIPHMVRTARALEKHAIAGIDLNFGCPAPKVFRKNVGGGLLRDLPKLENIVAAMREAYTGKLTVKTRIGFADTKDFDALLDIFARHRVDGVVVHARTVRELYRSQVHYEFIAQAVARLEGIPVIANGDITSVAKAAAVRVQTGCAGVMVGRSAIRNPWIFRQLAEAAQGAEIYAPTLGDVRAYVHEMWEELTGGAHIPDGVRLGRLKKMLNFVGQSVDPQGEFLKKMRPTSTPSEIFAVCETCLGGEHVRKRFVEEPYPGVVARPNCETLLPDA